MGALYITLSVLLGVLLLGLAVTLICFFRVFYLRRTGMPPAMPNAEIYEAHRAEMDAWVAKTRAMPHKTVYIRSHDGLRLRAKLYTYREGAPVEIMLHGYRGSAERDLSGGVERAFASGHSALIVDQRGCGGSEGHMATFGILERHDCERWVRFVTEELCPGCPVILTGISMGASTVMLCAAQELPREVIGVLADCGFTSARAIIEKVIRDMHLPSRLLYPFVRLSARLFGGFRLDEVSSIDAMRQSRLPVLLFHGDADAFVPCTMSEENASACAAPCALHIIEGAGHGLCYPVDKEGYVAAVRAFFLPLEAAWYEKSKENITS